MVKYKKQGSLLENNIKRILQLTGFDPELNKQYHGYEIDVFVSYAGKKIGIECKQYEKSHLSVRNLLHQWDSKNKELKLDRIILALIGCSIPAESRKLAKKYNILIWDEKKIDYLLDKAIENGIDFKTHLLKEFDIKTDSNEKKLGEHKKDSFISMTSSHKYPVIYHWRTNVSKDKDEREAERKVI